MLDLINFLSRSYLKQNVENAEFNEFVFENDDPFVTNLYPQQVYGFIRYAVGEQVHDSPRIRVQYYQYDSSHEQLSLIRAVYGNEVTFFKRIWPLCVNHATRDLMPKFLVAASLVGHATCMGALMFEHPADLRPWEYAPIFDDNHLYLMARRIGQFHGRMMETRIHHPQKLSAGWNALTILPRPNFEPHVPRLEAGILRLRRDRKFMRNANAAGGVSRLQELVDNLAARLEVRRDANHDRFVTLCHQGYTPKSCFFEYRGAEPIKATIGSWGTAGVSSFADDLLMLLFADAEPIPEERHLRGLIAKYVEGLHEASGLQAALPTRNDVWNEIRNRAPLILYVVARRVSEMRGRPNPGDPEGGFPWDDNFLKKVYKLLILANVI